MKRFFEDVELGDELGPLERTATDEQVQAFCAVWGNPEPGRFTSLEAARREGLPEPIVPGIMTMALMSQLVTDAYPAATLRLLDIIFRQPVLHNRPLTLVGVVTDKNLRDGQGVVEADLYLQTAERERLVTGKASFLLPQKG